MRPRNPRSPGARFTTAAPVAALFVGAALVAVTLFGAGCVDTPAAPAAAPVSAPPSVKTAAPSLDGDASSDGGSEASFRPALLSRPVLPLCGCALCSPVVSEDACTQDSDCAPATPCHAEACVAKAKAKPSTPRTACTMILRCDSVDANTCGCLEGRCALYPRKK